MVTEKGLLFVSSVIQKLTEVLGYTLRDTSTKHAQTFGVLESLYATIKMTLKLSRGDFC